MVSRSVCLSLLAVRLATRAEFSDFSALSSASVALEDTPLCTAVARNDVTRVWREATLACVATNSSLSACTWLRSAWTRVSVLAPELPGKSAAAGAPVAAGAATTPDAAAAEATICGASLCSTLNAAVSSSACDDGFVGDCACVARRPWLGWHDGQLREPITQQRTHRGGRLLSGGLAALALPFQLFGAVFRHGDELLIHAREPRLHLRNLRPQCLGLLQQRQSCQKWSPHTHTDAAKHAARRR